MICKYKNIFGEPRKGAHSYRLFDIAIVDVVSTVILAAVISKIWKLDFIKVLIIVFLLGIILHRLFCVDTTIDRVLF
jgi:hypothetical protein